MSPEFGSTAAIFPIDEVTIDYLRMTGRSDEQLALVEAYAKEQGMWHDPDARAEVLRVHRAGPGRRRRVDRRPEASAGPHRADRREDRLPQGHSQLRRGEPARRAHQARRGGRGVVPGQRPRGAVVRRQRHPGALGGRQLERPAEQSGGRQVRGPRRVHPRPRRGGDRGDHVVHQHLQPRGDARRGAARQERRREGPDVQAVGEDHDGAGLAGGDRLLRQGRRCGRIWRSWASTWSATAARRASATPARCPRRSARPSTTATFRSPRCFPATATSRAGSTPT